jgi:site-specific DNA recombinase
VAELSEPRLVALYARVSTEEQAREGQSLATQISRLSHYASSRGFDNPRVFVDDGYSAKNMNRPALSELLALIREGRVEAVCTMAIDRLSRNLLDMLKFIELCEQHNTSFICTALNFDTSSPIGRMTLQMLAAFAEFERSMIASRVRSNMHEIVRQKRRFLSSPPFGYALDSDGALKVVESEAQWVRAAADMFLGGRGYREIARWLNENGAPKTRRGNAWSPSSVKAMLANRTYTGTIVWGRRCTDAKGRVAWKDEGEWTVALDAHAPIIDHAKWNEVVERMQARRNRGGIHRSRSRLAGLVRCGHCGSKMVSRIYSNRGPNKGRRIYVCSAYQKKGTCRFNYVFADVLEAEVLRGLSAASPDLPAPDLRGPRLTGPRTGNGAAAGHPDSDATVPGFLSWLWHEADVRTLHRFLELVLECCVVTDRELEEVRISSRLTSPKHNQDCL